MPTVSMSRSLKQPGALPPKCSSWLRMMSAVERKLSRMSVSERYMCAPTLRIHLQGSPRPQLQAEKRISRPLARSAMLIVR